MMQHTWEKLPECFAHLLLDQYIIMPNHLHGIIIIHIDDAFRATTKVAPTIGRIIGAFKSVTTCQYINRIKSDNWPAFEKRLWQRNYYEHIIRNETSLYNIKEYIYYNPINWHKDKMNQHRSQQAPV